MSMTREEALAYALRKKAGLESEINKSDCGYGNWVMYSAELDFTNACVSALLPVSREQVEKVRGEWIDIDGEKVPVDKYGQPFGWAMCSACGEYLTASDEYPCTGHFCPNCGAPMTDEAVDMVMERLEALYE